MSEGKSLEIEAKVEVHEKSKEVVTAKPPDVLQRFDFTAKVQVEESGMKEETNLKDDKKVEVKKSCHANWDPGELVDAKAKVEVSVVKEVKQIDDLKMREESRCANWDPGELVNAKEQIEMLDVEEVTILVNDDKVRLRGNVNWKVFHDIMTLYTIVLFNVKAILNVLFLSRFVNGFCRKCPIELSDYG